MPRIGKSESNANVVELIRIFLNFPTFINRP